MLISQCFFKMLTIKNITCSAKIKHAIYTRLMNKELITLNSKMTEIRKSKLIVSI